MRQKRVKSFVMFFLMALVLASFGTGVYLMILDL